MQRFPSGQSNLRCRPRVRAWDREAWKKITLRPPKVKCERQTGVESAMQYRCFQRKFLPCGAAVGMLKQHELYETQASPGQQPAGCITYSLSKGVFKTFGLDNVKFKGKQYTFTWSSENYVGSHQGSWSLTSHFIPQPFCKVDFPVILAWVLNLEPQLKQLLC